MAYWVQADDQTASLRALGDATVASIPSERIYLAARAITQDCAARNDICELKSLYDAVKRGDPRVKGLESGVRYVGDPIYHDTFITPDRLLKNCELGAYGEDCDGHAALLAALAASIGFLSGLRTWGPGKLGDPKDHVYAVVAYPKVPPYSPRAMALDTTVPTFNVGDEPPGPNKLTCWLLPEDADLTPPVGFARPQFARLTFDRARLSRTRPTSRASLPGFYAGLIGSAS